MRTFRLFRREDATGISGTGYVAEGVVFKNGMVALSWLTEKTSAALYNDLKTAIALHGHNGLTEFRFDDEDRAA